MNASATVASRRRKLLLGALAFTLAATVWLARQDDDAAVVQASPRPTGVPRSGTATTGPGATSSSGVRPLASSDAQALAWPAPPAARAAPWPAAASSALLAWAPPPPPTPAVVSAAPAGPPPAPPFAYTLIGFLDDGQAQALLAGPVNTIAVKVHDVVDGQWRVDAVQPRIVTLTWLPGQQQKTLTD